MARSAWHNLVSVYQRRLPRDATPQDRARAMQRAAEEWNRRKGGRPVADNPSGGQLVKLAVIAGVGYVVAKQLGWIK